MNAIQDTDRNLAEIQNNYEMPKRQHPLLEIAVSYLSKEHPYPNLIISYDGSYTLKWCKGEAHYQQEKDVHLKILELFGTDTFLDLWLVDYNGKIILSLDNWVTGLLIEADVVEALQGIKRLNICR